MRETGGSDQRRDRKPRSERPDAGAAGFEEDEDRREDFGRILAEFESSREAATPDVGSRVHGKIVQIGEGTSFVDFGGRSEGAIETAYFRNEAGELTVAVGDTVDLFVIDSKDQVILAPSVRAEPAVALSQVVDARRTGMPISGQVVGLNAGGLEVEVAGLHGFCPVSQVDAGYCPDPSVYLGRSLEFLVTEIGEGGKRLVLSRRALLRRQEEERARALLGTLDEGQELDGTVTKVERFGAFVDLGGVEGLVHVSEIRYERVENPADVLSPGMAVRVKVLSVTEKEGQRPRISLSMKAAAPDPWDQVDELYWVGRRARGVVARLADFGAFITLSPGIDGLVHVSEIDLKPVAHPRDVLKVGQAIEVVVLSVDREKRRISLSIRDALAADQAALEMAEAMGTGGGAGGGAAGSSGSAAGAGSPPSASGTGGGPSAVGSAAGAGSPGGGSGAGAGGPGAGSSAIGPAASVEPRTPRTGDLADGWVASIKPYGLFVDLPAYGHRARGLVPFEETGEKPGTDLARRFKVGDQVRVEILPSETEGKIRLSMTRAQRHAEDASFRSFQASSPAGGGPGKGPNTAMAEALRRAMEDQQKKRGG
jgi:small subunit ribosomal protein S1